jgi:hypothetical protein
MNHDWLTSIGHAGIVLMLGWGLHGEQHQKGSGVSLFHIQSALDPAVEKLP